jgi:hypothetical protein
MSQSFLYASEAQECFADSLPDGVFDGWIIWMFWRDQGRFFGFFE